MNKDQTVPFYNVKKDDRDSVVRALRRATEGNRKDLTIERARAAFAHLVGNPESSVAGYPTVEHALFGPVLHIPLKGFAVPAIVSLAQLQKFI